MQALDIVFRSCDRQAVHPERGPRYIDVDKNILIKKCFNSLLSSLLLCEDKLDVKFWLLDDNSTSDIVFYIKNKLEKHHIPYNIEICENQGFNYSAYRQFELCRDIGRELVYCVEDDYLHFNQCVPQMVKMYDHFYSVVGREVAIKPDDDLFSYATNNPMSNKSCMVLMGEDRHWRTTYGSHNTLFTHVNVFKMYWELFASLSKFFKVLSVNEDKTINLLWEKAVPLFSPIPTLALHISQGNEPKFVNYKSLWESIEI